MGFTEFWPVLVFISGLFIAGVGTAVGLTMWIMGKLIEQDAKRIEMKESILKEVRERHRDVMHAIEQRYNILDAKIDNLIEEDNSLGTRLAVLEATNGSRRGPL